MSRAESFQQRSDALSSPLAEELWNFAGLGRILETGGHLPNASTFCGRCAEVCPYHSVVILDLKSGTAAGTPLVEAEVVPCYLCMECVTVCDDDALK